MKDFLKNSFFLRFVDAPGHTKHFLNGFPIIAARQNAQPVVHDLLATNAFSGMWNTRDF